MMGVRVFPATRTTTVAMVAGTMTTMILIALILSEGVAAFSIITNIADLPSTRCRPPLPTILTVMSNRRMQMERRRSVLMMTGTSDEKEEDDDDEEEVSKRRFKPQQGDDSDFYRDLERAKIDKLGIDIPPEQARQSAIQAEQDFLAAMKEVSKEFQDAKEELGSDGAVDLFLNRIRQEDEEEAKEQGKGNDENVVNDDDDDENLGAFE